MIFCSLSALQELLYRGETTGLQQPSAASRLRRRLERLWRRNEKCKRKRYHCTNKRKLKILKKIRLLLQESDADNILSHREAKWIVQRPRLKIRHNRSRNSRIESLFFNLQDKLYPNGYYQILVSLNDTRQEALPEKFM